MSEVEKDDTLILVSGDSHVGPRLKEDLREYCPANYLDEFDRFTEALYGAEQPFDKTKIGTSKAALAYARRCDLNAKTAGHYDVHARLADMDWDGVAAEVIFHGSQNGEAFPFAGVREWATADADRNVELVGIGYEMYNRWLADFCSVEPDRHVGLIYAPMWDVDLAIASVKKWSAAGLKGVNFPAPRAGIAEYDDPTWEPFWATCEDLGLSLATHAGVPLGNIFGPQKFAITRIEVAGWLARRAMHRMIFAGIFERYPLLNLTFVEQIRGWWAPTRRELDQVYGTPSDALRAQLPKRPSHYMAENIFVGASGGLMPPIEVEEAIREGFSSNMVWGSDYPHGEGTYKYPESDDEPSTTRNYLRWAFEGCPEDEMRKVLGLNGIRAFRMDHQRLSEIASKVGPKASEISTPLTEVPDEWKDVNLDIYA